MAEIEKVFKGLECCDGNGVKCDSCPYWQDIPDEYQVSCNDHLCRDAKEIIEEAYSTIGSCYSKIDELIEEQWIYVTDDKPKSSGVYNVARWFIDGERKVLLTDSCYFDGSVWHDDTRINHSREYMTDKIVAWMPLPEPPKAGEQE